MMNICTERVISLTEAAAMLPRRRRGRKPHPSTLYRWSVAGCRGVVLETCQVGGTRCTTVEALERFVAKLTAQAGRAAVPPIGSAAPHLQAQRELDRAGW